MLRTTAICFTTFTVFLTSICQAQQSSRLERLARRIEPDLEGQAERLPQYVDFFQHELGNDPRLFAFQVTATSKSAREVELTGSVEFDQTRRGIEEFLEVLGFTVENKLTTLPAEELGEKRLGFVKVTNTLSYSGPEEPRSVVTDCLLGEQVFLLREEADHYLVHSVEGYVGYVPVKDIHCVDEDEFASYLNSPNVRVTMDFESEDGLVIPTGARLKFVDDDDGEVVAELPTGKSVTLPTSNCVVQQAPAAKIEEMIASAKRLLGTEYLWGGKTSAGVDCSGLVQVGFAAVGMHLPRDSNQQVLVGRLSATRHHMAGLRRGDTLYFLGSFGRIRHTGIYLGGDRFLHAVSPQVRINSFNPEHSDYDVRRHESFAFAKRVVD